MEPSSVSTAGKLELDPMHSKLLIHVSAPGRTRVSYDCGGEPCTAPAQPAQASLNDYVLRVSSCPACGQTHAFPLVF